MSLRALLPLTRGYRRVLLLLVFASLASSLVMLAVPWLAGRMLGGILLERSAALELLALLLAALIVLAALGFVTAYLSRATAARLLADLRVRIYSHLQHLPLAFHHAHRQGDILALATFEVARLGQFLTGTLVSLPARILTAVGAVVLMFRIDAKLALLVPALVPAFYLVLKLVGRRLRWLAVAAQEAEADVIATIDRNLSMIPAIKAFAREDAETAQYRQRVDASRDIAIREGRINAALEPLVGLIAAGAAVVLLYVAGQNVRSGTMSGVELFSFLFYAALLTRPVSALAHLYGEIQTTRGTLERLQSVLRIAIEPGYAGHIPVPAARGQILFSDVDFAYAGRGPLLRRVTLAIEAGEKVALIGDNGAGKTTLVNLLLRLSDPDRGTIWLDGQDISGLRVQDLRRQVGIVPQRAALFNGSVRDNIAFGLDGASDAQVVRAARLAQAHDFITALPAGYETQIGDHGVRLSGGQRQRLSLARALVKDPPVLVFDEATAMFDVEGERAFIAVIGGALEGRTVIIITHRPASLALADRILSVEQGTVREVVPSPGSAVAAAIR